MDSFRETERDSQHEYGGSQSSVTPNKGDLTPSLASESTRHTHGVQAKHPYT